MARSAREPRPAQTPILDGWEDLAGPAPKQPRAKRRSPAPKRPEGIADLISHLQLWVEVGLLTALRAGPSSAAPLAWYEAGLCDERGLTRKGEKILRLLEDLASALDQPL